VSSRHLHASAFFTEAVARDAVWLLRIDDADEVGYAQAGTPAGEIALGLWSTENRARRITEQVLDYAGYRPERVSLEDSLTEWLPELDRSFTNVGLNWSGPRVQGMRVTTYALLRGIRAKQWDLSASERMAQRAAEWGD
jgi:hypothetical protein